MITQRVIKLDTDNVISNGYNRSFTNIKNHTILETPILQVINIRLQEFPVIDITSSRQQTRGRPTYN
jgi:hypothetical protein